MAKSNSGKKKAPAKSPVKAVTPKVKVALPEVIEWSEKEVLVKELRPYERNPRRISVEEFDRLKDSIKRNGYHQRILVMQDLSVIGGHQRIRALTELGIKKIKVLVPDRELSEEQFKEIMIKDNLPFGSWDFDILSSDYEPDQLVEYGMPKEWLPDFSPGGDQPKLDEAEEKEEVEPQLIHCPSCNHEFSILTKSEE